MARELEFTLHNGFGLKESSLPSNMKPYANIFVEGYPEFSEALLIYPTALSLFGIFSFKFTSQTPFPVDTNVVFEIWHSSFSKIDRKMGRVKLPLQNLLSGEAFANKVSYAVHISDKVVMGEIIISHKYSIISPSNPPANVPAIELSNDTPLRPSRSSFKTLKGLANCFIVVQSVTELISDFIS